jgi:hypothetical protein
MDYSGQILDAVGEFRLLLGFAGSALRINGFYKFLCDATWFLTARMIIFLRV